MDSGIFINIFYSRFYIIIDSDIIILNFLVLFSFLKKYNKIITGIPNSSEIPR